MWLPDWRGKQGQSYASDPDWDTPLEPPMVKDMLKEEHHQM